MEKIVAPTALLVAVAYHFGRRYTFERADYFGINESLFNYNTQEYVQRSVDPLFEPVGILILASIAAVQVNKKIVYWVARRRFTLSLRAFSYVVATCGFIMLLGGILSIRYDVSTLHPLLWPLATLHPLAWPLATGIGILLFTYGIHLGRSIKPTTAALSTNKTSATRYLVAFFLILSLFWTMTVYAAVLGTGRSKKLANELHTLPGVVIFSTNELAIQQPGVTKTMTTDPDSKYKFHYEGLRLFVEADNSLFLIPEEWTRTSGSVVVLKNDDTVRFEFHPR